MKRKQIIYSLLFACVLLCGGLISCVRKPNYVSPTTPQKEESSSPVCQHTYGEWITQTAPSCTEVGWDLRKCTLCGKTEDRYPDALGHVEGEWEIIHAPTCAFEGQQEQHCEQCGELLDATSVGKLTTHELEIDLDRKPTCTNVGLLQKSCACLENTTAEFIPDLGGHVDEDNDLICDTCTEGLRRIPVQMICQGNASATVPIDFLYSEESGGVIPVIMGENSILYRTYRLYSPDNDQPELGGNVLVDPMNHLYKWEVETLTTTFLYHVQTTTDFEGLQSLSLEIADTTQTAVAIVWDKYENEQEENYHRTQVYLHWGPLVDETNAEEMNNPANVVVIDSAHDSLYSRFTHYAYADGELLSTKRETSVILTKPVVYLYAYYEEVDND